MKRSSPLLVVMALASLNLAPAASAEEIVRVANRDELVRALREAKPGTTVLIASGTYRGGLSQTRLQGTKEQPIVVAGADPKEPPVIEGGGSGLRLSSPVHLVLRDLTFAKATGNGINIDDGGSAQSPAHDLVLRGIIVRDVGPTGNRDAIKLSGVNDFRIEGCRIARWGSGGSGIDMVGCQRGVISRSTFAEGGSGANGVQAKGGSQEIVIERCRFENAGGRAINIGGSTGLDYFRASAGDFEAKRITVQDCEILFGMSAIAFVGVDGALVQHNTIYCPARWAFRILQENTDPRFIPCRNGAFKNNLIAFRAGEVRQIANIGPKTKPESFEFTGNHWHCLDRPADTQRLIDLPTKEQGGIYNQPPGFKDADKGDVSTPKRSLTDAGVRADHAAK